MPSPLPHTVDCRKLLYYIPTTEKPHDSLHFNSRRGSFGRTAEVKTYGNCTQRIQLVGLLPFCSGLFEIYYYIVCNVIYNTSSIINRLSGPSYTHKCCNILTAHNFGSSIISLGINALYSLAVYVYICNVQLKFGAHITHITCTRRGLNICRI